jgi:hypothetical protein
MKTQLILNILVDYYTNKQTELRTNGRRNIFFRYGNLERGFNGGHGCLSFATIKEDVLVINELLLSRTEKSFIKATITVPYVFVQYGYPYYYNNSLGSLYIPS